jgi:uncharacterized protein (TIGR03435 family)
MAVVSMQGVSMMRPVVLIVLGLVVVALPLFPQAPARPQFEVVSIKVHPPPLTRIIVMAPPGRFVAEGFSPKMLVGRAYGLPDVRVVGGPGWVESERYDIEAKAEGSIPAGQLPLMLQSMLEDRFQLKAHKETRDLPVYELVVARGGSKLKLSEDQTPPTPGAPPPAGGWGAVARGPVPAPGGPGVRGGPGPFGGGPPPRGAFGGGRGNLQGTAVPLTTLTNFLTNQLGRPVYDKTGLSGLFDIKLEWTPGNEQAPLPFGPAPDAPPPPADGSGPSLFTALQEQLGLRTKGPVEVVVIENAQKPAEN